jgi:hypothetical protein
MPRKKKNSAEPSETVAVSSAHAAAAVPPPAVRPPASPPASAAPQAVAPRVTAPHPAPAPSIVCEPASAAAGTIAAAVSRLLLVPLRVLVYGVEPWEPKIRAAVEEKLAARQVLVSGLVPPAVALSGPAVQAMLLTEGSPELRALYAGLLATAMDRDIAATAHPAYVEVIKQLAPDETRLLTVMSASRYWPIVSVLGVRPDAERYDVLTNVTNMGVIAGCEFPDRAPFYLDNLRRLGVVDASTDSRVSPLAGQEAVSYTFVNTLPVVAEAYAQIAANGDTCRIDTGVTSLTVFGAAFCKACL